MNLNQISNIKFNGNRIASIHNCQNFRRQYTQLRCMNLTNALVAEVTNICQKLLVLKSFF